jgi:hypothetical protein
VGLLFGAQDQLDCLTNTTFEGPHGEQLCLASHISLYFFGAGVYVSDEGYVLKDKGESSYYKTTPDQLKALQAEGTIPTPLPPYQISTFQYLFGYSLWILLLVMAVAAALKRMFGKLRPFLLANVAPVTGPPVNRNEWDTFLSDAIGKQLEPGEQVQHQALATDFEPGSVAKSMKLLYLALTDRRLLSLTAVTGLGKFKKEVGPVESWPRTAITGVTRDELALSFHLADGNAMTYWIDGSQRTFTNQWLFARDVPKLLTPVAAAAS